MDQPMAASARGHTEPFDLCPALLRRHAAPRPPADPLDLLWPDHQATPLLGREEELADLLGWLGAGGPSARCLIGDAGTGKTRLGIELCARAEAQGWRAGFAGCATLGELARAVQHTTRWPAPLLVVVDRAADRADEIRTILGAGSRADLRLLLLERDGGWAAGLDVARVRLGGLRAVADRVVLLEAAMRHGALLGRVSACPAPPGAALDSGEPLHLMMAGLLAPHPGVADALALPPAALARRLAAAEAARLEQAAWGLGVEPFVVRHVAACVTLQDGCMLADAAWLIGEEAHALGLHLPHGAAHTADALADLLSDDGEALRPIGPDLLGGAFVLNELERHCPEARCGIIARARGRGGAAVDVMLRVIARDHAAD